MFAAEGAVPDDPVAFLERIMDVLGRVYVSVDRPHEEAGPRRFATLRPWAVLTAFEIAHARRPNAEPGRG